jgi:hypothetical protein
LIKTPEQLLCSKKLIVETFFRSVFRIEIENGFPLDGNDPLSHQFDVLGFSPVAEENVLVQTVIDFQLKK